jgi:hypothetical protein
VRNLQERIRAAEGRPLSSAGERQDLAAKKRKLEALEARLDSYTYAFWDYKPFRAAEGAELFMRETPAVRSERTDRGERNRDRRHYRKRGGEAGLSA